MKKNRIVSFLLCGLLLMFLGLYATETAKAQCNVQRNSANSAQSDAAAIQNAAIQQQLATLRLQAASQPAAVTSATAMASAGGSRTRLATPQKAYLIVSGAPVQTPAPVRAPSTPPPAPVTQSSSDLLLLPVAASTACDTCRRKPLAAIANLLVRDNKSTSRSVAVDRNGRTRTKAVARS